MATAGADESPHPHLFWVVENYDDAKMYHRLVLIDHPSVGTQIWAWLNRESGFSALLLKGGEMLRWTAAYAVDDPREFLAHVDRGLGLSVPPRPLPASSASSLAVRWIAQFLTMQVGSYPYWSSTQRRPERSENEWADLPRAEQGDVRYWTP